MDARETKVDAAEITRLLQLDEPTLLHELSDQLFPSDGALGMSHLDRIAKARRWMAENNMKLKSMVCGSPKVREYLHDTQKREDIELVALIIHLLFAELKGAVVTLVAVLIVRRGVVAYCKDSPG